MTISVEGNFRYRIIASPGWWISFYLTDVEYMSDEIEKPYADIDPEITPYISKVCRAIYDIPGLPRSDKCILENCIIGLFEYMGNKSDYLIDHVVLIPDKPLKRLIEKRGTCKTKEWREFVKALSPLVK